MPHAQHTVTISRPPLEVFTYLADGETCTQWRRGVIAVHHLSGSGVGAKYQQTVRGPGGRGIPADYEITEYTPNVLIAFQVSAGPVRPRGRYEFEEGDGVTTVTFTLDVELRGFKRLVMSGMVSKTMADEVAALDNVKAILEERP